MRRVDRHWSQERVQFIPAVVVHHIALCIVEVCQRVNFYAMFG
jgi:hypothetical protein